MAGPFSVFLPTGGSARIVLTGPANARMALIALALVLAGHAIAFVFGLDLLKVPARGRFAVTLRRDWMRSRWPLARGIALALILVLTLLFGYVESAQFVYFQF